MFIRGAEQVFHADFIVEGRDVAATKNNIAGVVPIHGAEVGVVFRNIKQARKPQVIGGCPGRRHFDSDIWIMGDRAFSIKQVEPRIESPGRICLEPGPDKNISQVPLTLPTP